MTSAPPARKGSPRRRLLALAALLVLSLTLAAVLAWQAVRTAARHRQTAERTLHDYATFAAFILASHAYRQVGQSTVGLFAGWRPGKGPGDLPAGTACPAGSSWLDTPPGAPAPRFGGVALSPADRAVLADTLKQAMALLSEVGWRFRFVRTPHATFDGIFIASYQVGDGFGLRGYVVCLGGTDSPLRRVMLAERALPPTVTGGLPADSLFSISVASGIGRPVYVSPEAYPPVYVSQARLGVEFGDLTLHLALRPDIAGRLVIGGLPTSPAPLAIGLLGLSTLLVVTALLQLRREYELIAIRSEFVSSVSHELRTPLSQILLFTELLRLGRLRSAAERSRSLEVIDQEARRLIRLVENVLQFSRAAGGRRRLSSEPVAVAPLVRDVLEAFRPLAEARGVTLRSDVPASAAVQADPGAVRQVLLNLLDNAVKYGPKGQTVTIEAAGRNGRTTIRVDDQGPGVPLDDRERVWEGYFRLPREAQSAVAGSGIGLSVVRSLVTEMRGRAWVEDTETGGARFVVELATAELETA